ncbi:hypothetical protein V5T82_05825 [Magnetovibrio sp. PR-2]|uniref:hypothetical protein n=1 Tax=Magnetovibrio sp. PR-2 TaxID=3120356 RepID=UPI002FCE38E5
MKLSAFALLEAIEFRHDPPMHEPIPTAQPSLFLRLGILFSAGLFAFLIIALRAYMNETPPPWVAEWFVGPDAYMRMVRVLDWWQNGTWYETQSLRSNWPYGEVQHWTRPLDVVMVALATPLSWVLGVAKALFWVGVVISPLIACLSMAVLVWGTRGVLDLRGQALFLVLFAFQPITRAYFLAARPDHHSLILLGYCIVLAMLLRFALAPSANQRLMAWAGASSAFGVWVSIEGLTTELFALFTLALPWLLQGRVDWLKGLRTFTFSSAVLLTVMLAVERPPSDWLVAEEYDRLSMVHVWLFWLIAAGVELIWRLQAACTQNSAKRWGISALSAALASLFMYLSFHDFFKGPFGAAMDQRLDHMWLEKIGELQPLVGHDWATNVGGVLVLLPVVWLIVWAVKTQRERTPGTWLDERVMIVALPSLLFFPMAIFQMRWGAYFGVTVSLAWAALFQRLLDWNGGPKIGSDPGTPILRIPAVLGLVMGHVAVAIALALIAPEAEDDGPSACQWRDLAPHLNSQAFSNGKPQVILSHIHQGPEILYRTPHRVIGSPYHRNTQGILDAYRAVTVTDPETVRNILDARKVNYLILCVNSGEERHALKVEGDIMMRRYREGREPSWLVKQSLQDPELDQAFRIYRYQPSP